MLFGSFILKPDFFENKSYLDVFLKLIEQNECELKQGYIIKNYTNVNLEYRRRDIIKRFKNKNEFDKTFNRTKIAYDSYSMLGCENIGVLLLIISKKDNDLKTFYNKLNSIKEDLRQHIKNSRNFAYLYLKKDDCEPKLIKSHEDEFEMMKNKYGKAIKLAFINGIHLEDFDLFKHHFCYKTFRNLGVVNAKNSINPQDIGFLFNKFSSVIDLHIHSNYSDGKFSNDEIYKKCKMLNLKYAAICDHDGINTKLAPNLNFINGIELNVLINETKQHVLCYNLNVNNKYLSKILQIQKKNREMQLDYRLAQLKDTYNFTFAKNDIDEMIISNHFSREYLAKLMVKYGYCETVEMALTKYINKLKHGKFLIDLKQLAKLVHKGNGKLVLAHPLGNYKKRISFESFNQADLSFVKFLDGIETFYSNYNNAEIKSLFEYAQHNKLICTCGSDFHGTRPIDENIGKICNEELNFENKCNYLIVKKQIEENLFRRRND